MKLLKNFTIVTLIVLLIAALILLKKCGKDRDTYQQQAAQLRQEAQADDSTRLRQDWQYSNDTATYRSEAREQAKKADSIQKITRTQSAEIRALYRELGQPWSTDTIRIGTECCSLAVQVADQYESLLLVDSLKDGAYLAQIDLATVRIDTLQNQLDRSDRRFWVMDSLKSAPVKTWKVSLGVAGGVAPGFGWAGAAISYEGPGGTGIHVEVGPSNLGGFYKGAKVTRVIRFKKRR